MSNNIVRNSSVIAALISLGVIVSPLASLAQTAPAPVSPVPTIGALQPTSQTGLSTDGKLWVVESDSQNWREVFIEVGPRGEQSQSFATTPFVVVRDEQGQILQTIVIEDQTNVVVVMRPNSGRLTVTPGLAVDPSGQNEPQVTGDFRLVDVNGRTQIVDNGGNVQDKYFVITGTNQYADLIRVVDNTSEKEDNPGTREPLVGFESDRDFKDDPVNEQIRTLDAIPQVRVTTTTRTEQEINTTTTSEVVGGETSVETRKESRYVYRDGKLTEVSPDRVSIEKTGDRVEKTRRPVPTTTGNNIPAIVGYELTDKSPKNGVIQGPRPVSANLLFGGGTNGLELDAAAQFLVNGKKPGNPNPLYIGGRVNLQTEAYRAELTARQYFHATKKDDNGNVVGSNTAFSVGGALGVVVQPNGGTKYTTPMGRQVTERTTSVTPFTQTLLQGGNQDYSVTAPTFQIDKTVSDQTTRVFGTDTSNTFVTLHDGVERQVDSQTGTEYLMSENTQRIGETQTSTLLNPGSEEKVGEFRPTDEQVVATQYGQTTSTTQRYVGPVAPIAPTKVERFTTVDPIASIDATVHFNGEHTSNPKKFNGRASIGVTLTPQEAVPFVQGVANYKLGTHGNSNYGIQGRVVATTNGYSASILGVLGNGTSAAAAPTLAMNLPENASATETVKFAPTNYTLSNPTLEKVRSLTDDKIKGHLSLLTSDEVKTWIDSLRNEGATAADITRIQNLVR